METFHYTGLWDGSRHSVFYSALYHIGLNENLEIKVADHNHIRVGTAWYSEVDAPKTRTMQPSPRCLTP
jgi:hypothetical protein